MKTSDLDIIFIPGLGGAGPDHWQSRWAAKLSTAKRVELADWNAPARDVLVSALVEKVETCKRPALLVGYSLGAHAVAHAAPLVAPGRIVGAMLVAPTSDSGLRAIAVQSKRQTDFLPRARAKLPFASVLVASRNDPWCGYAASEEIAAEWGAKLLDAGESGHINEESGHGPWPEGLMSFAHFIRGL